MEGVLEVTEGRLASQPLAKEEKERDANTQNLFQMWSSNDKTRGFLGV